MDQHRSFFSTMHQNVNKQQDLAITTVIIKTVKEPPFFLPK